MDGCVWGEGEGWEWEWEWECEEEGRFFEGGEVFCVPGYGAG